MSFFLCPWFDVAEHTDDIANFEANMYISKFRADAVRTYLVTHCGIGPERLELVFPGSSRPLVPNTSAENRRRNRRVEFRRLR